MVGLLCRRHAKQGWRSALALDGLSLSLWDSIQLLSMIPNILHTGQE